MNALSFFSPFMRREVWHIYGPCTIYSYGLAIALGLTLFIMLIKRDRIFTQLKIESSFPTILMLGIISGVIGGKLLYILSEPISSISQEILTAQGGFSILGCMGAILATIPWCLHYYQVPSLPFFDLVAIYAPLIHAISRLGCFAAGCCYGIQTSSMWGVIYTDPHSAAPLYCMIHPTQLYSSAIFFMLFAVMYYLVRPYMSWPGGMLGCYLVGAGLERFFIDFLRADRIFFNTTIPLSINQLLALIFVGIGLGLIAQINPYKSRQLS